MELLRVFNNNVVLARETDGTQVILTGRGLGFQAKPGTEIDSAKVVKKFVPADGRDPDHMGQLLAQIPPEHVHMIVTAMREVGIEETSSPTLVLALADHLGFALARARIGQSIEYPLTGEVVHLYPDEYARASALLDALNRTADAELPKAEATAFTLHLVNAGFASGDLSWTYTMTGVIQQILKVAAQGLGIGLDSESISAGRFITHLRYLFVRIRKDDQLVEQMPSVVRSIIESYPRENACAKTIAQLVELRLGTVLTEDEIAYLTLHLARLSTPPVKN
ncbi:PRD domain-containing protein [Schaalia cardiffensis]|uniref:PRD domain-containing protein n=1 Tax=Schaalia cardiffensis TaxID=181487 RepID=UPI0018E8DB46|nr:PRD domain-containing protein [Schaalia cardiffensis]MBJ2328920.1 PRD domain-containing protein [Schaalia cardiffensis]